MRLVTSEYRMILNSGDREFVHAVLDPEGKQTDAIDGLIADPESAATLLDDARLYNAILDTGRSLSISPHLYFYLVLRHELKEAMLDDPQIPEYISWSLSEFSLEHPMGLSDPRELSTHFLNAVDFIDLVRSVDSYQKFMLELWAGNYYLIWSGLFHDFLERREKRHGAPGVKFYEKLGWSSFHFAQQHPLANEFEMRGLLDRVVDEYFRVRKALTRLSDEILVWN